MAFQRGRESLWRALLQARDRRAPGDAVDLGNRGAGAGMIGGQSVLGIIPARGGSKGVPRKNLRAVGGKPLLGWAIEAALRSRYLDRVVVSSDDAEIRAAAKALGCEALERPAELARDDTPGIAPVLHALSALQGHDWVV